ncbi:MAG: alpha/beta hydrolase [Succiniclasticum sp.]|jgi:fermentation-respiration switch protein FrsA (DUF1100 family)
MIKKFFLFLTVLLVVAGGVAAAAAWYVGLPAVDYALRRGSNGDPLAPPKAFEDVYPYPNKYEAMQPKSPGSYQKSDWSMTSFDGLKLAATHFVPKRNPDSHRWAILVHGYGCNQRFMYIMADYYLSHGYQVLTPDMRASGKSEGTYLTMGVYEGRDVAQWARAVVEQDPQARIILHGVSMGAADVLLAINDGLPSQVKAIVEDSSYSNLRELLAIRMGREDNGHRDLLLTAMNFLMKYRTGVWLNDVDPMAAVAKTTVPILFIHGTADQLIPLSMMKDLDQADPLKEKAALTVEGATHAMNDAVGDPYYRYVFSFTDRFVS